MRKQRIRHVNAVAWTFFLVFSLFVAQVLLVTTANLRPAQAQDTGKVVSREEEFWKYEFPEQNFEIKLGEFHASEQLAVKTVETNASGEKYIVWTYTTTLSNVQLGKPTEIRRNFSTSLDSGLGEPQIVSATKNGAPIALNPTTFTPSEAGTALFDSVGVKQTGSDLGAGTYVYEIKTKVLEPRDNYALMVHTLTNAQVIAGEQVTMHGVTQTMDSSQTITATNSITLNLPAELRPELIEAVKQSPQLNNVVSSELKVAGEYLDSSTIRWSATRTNPTDAPVDFVIPLELDASQAPKGATKVRYYRPGSNGFVLDREEEVSGTQLAVYQLEPGWIVQTVKEATVVDPTSNHTMGGAELASLVGSLEVRKIWHQDVTDAEKVDTSFTVHAPDRTFVMNIPAGQETATVQGIQKFDDNFQRIRYDVIENPVVGFAEYHQTVDRDTLRYSFSNMKRDAVNGNWQTQPGAGGSGKCTEYGITSVQMPDMNQYRLNDGRWLWGTDLRGTFRIPAGATGGDRFVLKLPPEVRLQNTQGPDPDKVFFNIEGIINGQTKRIGVAYHNKVDEITFVLWDLANHSQDYEGTFRIGWDLSNSEIAAVNNNSSFDRSKTYTWGFEPNWEYMYDPNDLTRKTFTKNLEFGSTYYGYNGEATACEKNIDKQVGFHFEDDYVTNHVRQVNKILVGETPDSLTYDVVFNAEQRANGLPAKVFRDYLTETIELYHGNSPTSLAEDIEIFEARGVPATGAYVPGSEVKLWPNGSTGTGGLRISDSNVVGAQDTSGSPFYSGLKHSYRVEIWPQNYQAQTIVMRIKVRKLKPWTDGNYHNEAKAFNMQPYVNAHEWFSHKYKGVAGRALAQFDKKFTVRFQKVDENGEPIRNNPATFRMLDGRWSGAYTRKVTADENGVVTFTDLLPEGYAMTWVDGSQTVSDGRYVLYETVAPEGYALDSTVYQLQIKLRMVQGEEVPIITINGEEYDTTANLFKITNKPFSNLTIRKTDGRSGEPLPGAVLRVKEYKLNDAQNALTETMNYTMGNNGGQNLMMSEFTLKNMKADYVYEVSEESAPEGYSQTTEKMYFRTKLNTGRQLEFYRVTPADFNRGDYAAKGDPANTAEPVELKNYRENFIEFKKVDQRGDVLQDSVTRFALYKVDPAGENTVLANGETKQLKIVKSAQGTVEGKISYSNLENGEYYLKEIVAPAGYQVPKYPVAKFTVIDGKVTSDSPTNNVAIPNYPLGKLKLFKSDDSTPPKPLAGVGFTLYSDSEGKNPVAGQVKNTDEKGIAYFENLPAGTYWLKETKEIAGYQNDGKLRKVVVTSTGEVLVEAPAGTQPGVAQPAAQQNPGAPQQSGPVMSPMALSTLYRQDPVFGQTINSDNLSRTQTISPTNQVGKYRVDVDINGTALANHKGTTDVLIMVERRQGTDYMFGSAQFYKDRIINDFLLPLKQSNPQARVALGTWATNGLKNRIFGYVSIDEAIRQLQNSTTFNNTVYDWNRDWNAFTDLTQQMLNESNAQNKVVFSLTGIGIYKRQRDLTTFNDPNTQQKLRNIISSTDFYSFSEASGYSSRYGNDYAALEPMLESLGAAPEKVTTAARYLSEISNDGLGGLSRYQVPFNNIANSLEQDDAELRIALADNVTLVEGPTVTDTNEIDGAQSLVYNEASKTILSNQLRFNKTEANPRLRFTYYVQSDMESTSATFDKFEKIATDAVVIPRRAQGIRNSIPRPELLRPGLDVTAYREWAATVPTSFREATLLNLMDRNGRTFETKVLASEAQANAISFAPVPLFDNQGQAIEYRIVEQGLRDGLASTIYYNNQYASGFGGADTVVKVSTDFRRVDYVIRKQWENTQGRNLADVVVELKAAVNGQPVVLQDLGISQSEYTLTSANGFETIASQLPYVNQRGERIYYSVVEKSIGGQPMSHIDSRDYSVTYISSDLVGTVINRRTTQIDVVNPRLYEMTVLKRDLYNESMRLNATFSLCKVVANQPCEVVGSGQTLTTINGVEVDGWNVKGLKAGTYKVTEVTAPEGYEKLVSDFTFTVSDNGEVSLSGAPSYVNMTVNKAEKKIEFTVQNRQNIVLEGFLPLTGGHGVGIYALLGLSLVGVAVLMVRRKSPRRTSWL